MGRARHPAQHQQELGFLRWSAPPRSPPWAAEDATSSSGQAPEAAAPGLKAGALSIRALPLPTPQLTPLLTDLETRSQGQACGHVGSADFRPAASPGSRCWPQALAQHLHPSLGLLKLTFMSGHRTVFPQQFRGNGLCTWDASGALSGGCARPLALWPLATPNPATSHFCFETSFLCVFLFLGIHNLKIIRRGKTEQQGARPSGL